MVVTARGRRSGERGIRWWLLLPGATFLMIAFACGVFVRDYQIADAQYVHRAEYQYHLSQERERFIIDSVQHDASQKVEAVHGRALARIVCHIWKECDL